MKRSGKRKTIYDLSALSGCSPSTVSAVLNGSWRKRRISEKTATLILKLADSQQYTANRQARGLRRSRSGLVGLLLPLYDNRYFSSLAQTFEAMVRARGECPIVASASRDPRAERETAESLIAYSVDELFICGATDPDGVHEICGKAGLRHVNIDLPGSRAPSVISDNYDGACRLTEAVIRHCAATEPLRPEELYIFGGRDDHASRERIRGFRAVKRTLLGADPDVCIQPTGYSADNTRLAFEAFFAREGRLPRAIIINSTINLEGFLRFMAGFPDAAFKDLVVGCYDYDPFASFLPFPVIMIRQNVEAMLAKAFEIIADPAAAAQIHLVAPELVPPRTALAGPLDALKDTPPRPAGRAAGANLAHPA